MTLPGEELVVTLEPAVADQELDTRATTGVVYWEGSQQVTATRAGRPLGGEAYVELTGYATAVTPATLERACSRVSSACASASPASHQARTTVIAYATHHAQIAWITNSSRYVR